MAAGSETITVRVGLRSVLARYRPDPDAREPFAVQLAAGSTLGDLLLHCGVPGHRAGMMLMDGKHSRREATLDEGVLVEVFPPIAGG